VKDAKEAQREGEHPVTLPPGYGPMVDQVVVPTPEALDLVKYLQSLDHTYPVLPAPPQS
jgi:cytochrome c oxidase cbb3-type subunit II